MKKLISIFFIAILFVTAGCKKSFFDINKNPNRPTEEQITAQLLLPRAINRLAAKSATSFDNYAGWMGYWSRSGTYGPNPATEGYNITSNDFQDQWHDWYDILFDFNTAEKKAAEAGQDYYVAMAKIMKAIGFMYLVDQYNNIPYTEAFNLSEHITPAYDKAPDVYKDLIKQLDAAIDLLNKEGVDSDPTIAATDIVFKKNVSQWKKLANTQKLRLLIHQSEANIVDAKAELTKTASVGFLDGITVAFKDNPEAISSSDGGAYVQPGYVMDNLKQNPFWDIFDTNFTGALANDFWRANNFILKRMYGLSGDNYNDERLFRVFDEPVTAYPPSDTWESYLLGTNYGEVVPSGGPQAVNQADVSGPGLGISAKQKQWIFTVVESRFLQAEAIQRGWIAGNAEAMYKSAVEASFTFLGVEEMTADDYLSQGGAFGARVTDFVGSNDNKIRIINTQKYIAMCGINNFEGWVDYRRLDGSKAILNAAAEQASLLSFSPSRSGRGIPLRLVYPQSEYNFNAANVGKEGTINAQSSRIFWDKGAR